MTALAAGKVRFIATGEPADTARGTLTLPVIRDELAKIVAGRVVDDPHLYYLDGRELATHHTIGERFARPAFSSEPTLAHGDSYCGRIGGAS